MYNSLMKRKNSVMKKNRKGFTLVEVIVVLVILAILAAILIPSMVGWIDKANEKTVVAEARAALLACQTLASETYGEEGTASVDAGEAATLADVDGTISGVTLDGAKVTAMVYANDDYTATWDGSAWSVE
ncbi:MAG TPA: prepilin-type N-terminal cleavage/methylation domain-containing protein [Bacillota bacterium]|nr:prepilin-type N-terminal cleavage/methylation domain-containing protein [Bacillota bacterium]HUM55697.1 prepilin-type N-terminal cleavage/methylation domain-containing protein [Bacillota bacterium]